MAYPTNVLHLATECANRSHSATFPIALPTWFIKLFISESDVVLDPFLGSGTTAAACVENFRQFIWIEINAEYVNAANQRIRASSGSTIPMLLETNTDDDKVIVK